MSSEENENPEPLAGRFGVIDGHLRSASNLANGDLESKGSAPRFPKTDFPATDAPLAVILRAMLLPALVDGWTPWDVANGAMQYGGRLDAPLDAANALRWQMAHAQRAIGQRRFAMVWARELLIDCDKQRAYQIALRDAFFTDVRDGRL